MDPIRAQSPALPGASAQAARRGEPFPTTRNITSPRPDPAADPAVGPSGATAAHLVREGRAAQFRHLNPRDAECALLMGVGMAVGAASMGLAFSGILHAGPMAAWSAGLKIGCCLGGASSFGAGLGGAGLVVLLTQDYSSTHPAAPANETVSAPPPQQMIQPRRSDIPLLVVQPNGAFNLVLSAGPRGDTPTPVWFEAGA